MDIVNTGCNLVQIVFSCKIKDTSLYTNGSSVYFGDSTCTSQRYCGLTIYASFPTLLSLPSSKGTNQYKSTRREWYLVARDSSTTGGVFAPFRAVLGTGVIGSGHMHLLVFLHLFYPHDNNDPL